MASETGFLDALRDNPGDLTTRLIFADWLEEQADPHLAARGELIRIQVRLAQWVPDLLEREALQAREQELLDRHLDAWQGPAVDAAIALPAPNNAISNSLGMRLALVPAGTFQMGSLAAEQSLERSANGPPGADERPRHIVTLSQPYYLGAFPVTQAEFEAVIGTNPSEFTAGSGGGPNNPVETVTWDMARQFCERLSELPPERAHGRCYRLPTEAEWEHACRAGRSTPFWWGDTATADQANFDGTKPYGVDTRGAYIQRTTLVGSYPANPFGLFDMHGNVWEWCSDFYDQNYYAVSPAVEPQGPAEGNRKATRGGSWLSSGSECRAACRDYWYGTSYARNNIGFRVVLEVGSPTSPV